MSHQLIVLKQKEGTMRSILLCALGSAFIATAIMTPDAAVAQDSAARDAAIGRCIRQAHTQYPDDNDDAGRNRTAVYKACMASAGFNP
jgi:hypothetical protein